MIRVVTSQLNIRYLSGFAGSVGILIADPANSTLIVDGRYTEQALSEVNKGVKVVTVPLGRSLWHTAIELLKVKKVSNVLIEDDKLDVLTFNKIKEKLPKVKFGSLSEDLREKRCVKTEKEISLIKEAARISDLAYDCLIRMISPGMSENDIAAELDYLMRIMGAESAAFETLVASGPNSARPHGKPSNRKLSKGDIVVLDFGARYKGYNSDMTRMISVGVPSKKLSSIYRKLLTAQRKAISKVRAGIKASFVDKTARDMLKKAGLAKYFSHSTGHGVGLAVHEGPRVAITSNDILKEGMIITIEPGVYIPGLAGFRIEDMVLVKKNGCEILTGSPTKLEVIT